MKCTTHISKLSFVVKYFLLILLSNGCSKTRNNNMLPIQPIIDTYASNPQVLQQNIVDPCEQWKKIELTSEEVKRQYEYLFFFRQKGLSQHLIPFYPDARLQLPIPNKKFNRIYIGKESVNAIKDYVIISIPFDDSNDTCCCIIPEQNIKNSTISLLNHAISKKCGVAVYNIHKKIDSYEVFYKLVNNYKEFMAKHLLKPNEFPQAFTIINSYTLPGANLSIIPLVPQREYVESCMKNKGLLLTAAEKMLAVEEGEDRSNTLVIPTKEQEKTGFSSCCQAPPMAAL